MKLVPLKDKIMLEIVPDVITTLHLPADYKDRSCIGRVIAKGDEIADKIKVGREYFYNPYESVGKTWEGKEIAFILEKDIISEVRNYGK